MIVNRTSADIIAYAMDQESAALFDPANSFEIASSDAVLASGEAQALTIGGYEPGEDFVVFVFRVRGTQATYASFLSADGQDFEDDDAVFTVRRF